MGFFKRLFSADYRAAVAAEAAGDLELAAERYALAGQTEAAVRIHLARAERAGSRKGEIAALRDAHHWSEPESDLRVRVAQRLGRALLAQVQAEGVATQRDKDRVRDAAAMLLEGADTIASAEAYESIDDDIGAAKAYRVGGHVDRLEDALLREESKGDEAREERSAYADYELASHGGDRDGALRALRRCIAAAGQKTEYRRLLDELEARLIASDRVTLLLGNRGRVSAFGGEKLLLGRDALCDLVLRSGGISRQHAEISLESGEDAAFVLADAGSKNGTRIGGIRIEGSVPLAGSGAFELGDHCTIRYQVTSDRGGSVLTLEIDAGLDRGTALRASRSATRLDLSDLGFPGAIYFRDARPILAHPGRDVRLGDQRIAHGDIQLIHGDQIVIEGLEVEVL